MPTDNNLSKMAELLMDKPKKEEGMYLGVVTGISPVTVDVSDVLLDDELCLNLELQYCSVEEKEKIIQGIDSLPDVLQTLIKGSLVTVGDHLLLWRNEEDYYVITKMEVEDE